MVYEDSDAKVAIKRHNVDRYRGKTADGTGRYQDLKQQVDSETQRTTKWKYRDVVKRSLETDEISFVEARAIVDGLGVLRKKLSGLKQHLRGLELSLESKKKTSIIEHYIRDMETQIKALAEISRKIRLKAEANGSVPENFWSDDKMEPLE